MAAIAFSQNQKEAWDKRGLESGSGTPLSLILSVSAVKSTARFARVGVGIYGLKESDEARRSEKTAYLVTSSLNRHSQWISVRVERLHLLKMIAPKLPLAGIGDLRTEGYRCKTDLSGPRIIRTSIRPALLQRTEIDISTFRVDYQTGIKAEFGLLVNGDDPTAKPQGRLLPQRSDGNLSVTRMKPFFALAVLFFPAVAGCQNLPSLDALLDRLDAYAKQYQATLPSLSCDEQITSQALNKKGKVRLEVKAQSTLHEVRTENPYDPFHEEREFKKHQRAPSQPDVPNALLCRGRFRKSCRFQEVGTEGVL